MASSILGSSRLSSWRLPWPSNDCGLCFSLFKVNKPHVNKPHDALLSSHLTTAAILPCQAAQESCPAALYCNSLTGCRDGSMHAYICRPLCGPAEGLRTLCLVNRNSQAEPAHPQQRSLLHSGWPTSQRCTWFSLHVAVQGNATEQARYGPKQPEQTMRDLLLQNCEAATSCQSVQRVDPVQHQGVPYPRWYHGCA